MSPTSYQAAPPRRKIISAGWWVVKPGSLCTGSKLGEFFATRLLFTSWISTIHLLPLTGIHDFRRIDGCAVQLFFQNLSIFADQEIDPAGGFVLVVVDAILARDVSSPVTQQREGDADRIGKGFVGERAVHAYTQDLGVGGFQFFQILLEGLHLLRSTARKGKNIKRQH